MALFDFRTPLEERRLHQPPAQAPAPTPTPASLSASYLHFYPARRQFSGGMAHNASHILPLSCQPHNEEVPRKCEYLVRSPLTQYKLIVWNDGFIYRQFTHAREAISAGFNLWSNNEQIVSP